MGPMFIPVGLVFTRMYLDLCKCGLRLYLQAACPWGLHLGSIQTRPLSTQTRLDPHWQGLYLHKCTMIHADRVYVCSDALGFTRTRPASTQMCFGPLGQGTCPHQQALRLRGPTWVCMDATCIRTSQPRICTSRTWVRIDGARVHAIALRSAQIHVHIHADATIYPLGNYNTDTTLCLSHSHRPHPCVFIYFFFHRCPSNWKPYYIPPTLLKKILQVSDPVKCIGIGNYK